MWEQTETATLKIEDIDEPQTLSYESTQSVRQVLKGNTTNVIERLRHWFHICRSALPFA